MRATVAIALTLGFGSCDDAPDASREAQRTLPSGATAGEHDADAPPRRTGPLRASAGCAILTEQQVEQALGYDVVMGDNSTGNCLVTPADESPASPAVDFKIEDRTAAYDYFAAQPDAEPIAGLGDRAVWATLNESTGNVVVVLGNRAVVVGIMRADGLDARARRQAEAIARAVVAVASRGGTESS